MSNIRLSALILTLFSVLCCIAPAEAQQPDAEMQNAKSMNAAAGAGHHGGGFRKKGGRLLKVNTPEAQKIRKKYQPEMMRLFTEIKNMRTLCAKELAQEKPSKDKIKSYIDKICELRCRQQKLLVDQMFEILETLPKEKRAEYLQPLIEHTMK